MRTPSINISPRKLLDLYGHYLVVRIGVVQTLSSILEFFTSHQSDLEMAVQQLRDAQLERQTAMALRDYQNDRVDQEIRILAFAILGQVNNVRSSPLFQHYFPNGFSEFVYTPLERQRRQARVLVSKLLQEEDEVIASRLEPFRKALQDLDAAVAAHEGALDKEASERANVLAEKGDWIGAYRKTYQMLKEAHTNQPLKAEKFFRNEASNRTAVDDVEDEIFEDAGGFDDGFDEEGLSVVTHSPAVSEAGSEGANE